MSRDDNPGPDARSWPPIIVRALFALVTSAVLGLPGCGGEPIPVRDPSVESQPERFTRHGIRGTTSGFVVKTYRSNYLGDPAVFRPGRKIQITLYSQERIDFLIDGSDCRMFSGDAPFPTDPAGVHATLEKHFALTSEELNLGVMAPERRRQVEDGEIAIGMTKDEVFSAVGFPAFIDARSPAATLTREKIFQSDTWIYRHGEVGPVYTTYQTFRFDEQGKLAEVVR